MEQDEVVHRRLNAQLLRGSGAQSPDDVVRHLLAVQAQEFPYARWSLAQRTLGESASVVAGPIAATTAADVEQAVSDGRILRTHILRPTWHFVHRDDLRWLMALSAPRLQRANAGTYRRTGIDAAAADRSGRVLAEAVQGGRHLTREQLAEHLRRAGFAASGLGLAYLIMHAEVSGVLASGSPMRSPGGALKQTYALFDERVPAGPAGPLDRDEALSQLARRYFTSRGPATVKDCADWSGLTMTDVRRGLARVLDSAPALLETVAVEGVEHYFQAGSDGGAAASGGTEATRGAAAARGSVANGVAAATRGTEVTRGAAASGGSAASGVTKRDGGLAAPVPRIDLIQCYDEYVMGYSATRHYLGGSAPAFPLGGAPMHVVLLDGRMAGSWRHTLFPDRCELDIRLFRSSDPASRRGKAVEHAVQSSVDRYGAFLGIPAARAGSTT
jgi:hypothetical protein